MNLINQIHQVLDIPESYIKIYSEGEALCLVHKNWMKCLRCGQRIPPELREKCYVDENLLNFYFSSENLRNKVWKIISVYRWDKNSGQVARFSKPREELQSTTLSLSYSQLIHYITKNNYKNLWEKAWKTYHKKENSKRNKYKQEYNDALREIFKRLFKNQSAIREDGTVVYTIDDSVSCLEKKAASCPNLLQAYCILETDESFLLICDKSHSNLRDCLMFSPFILTGSTVRPLFIVYQLLQSFCFIHNQGVFVGPLSSYPVNVNENLWVEVVPISWKYLHHYSDMYQQDQNLQKRNLSVKKSDLKKSTYDGHSSVKDGTKTLNASKLSALLEGWINGNISNYDYLMELNSLAGRQKNNPRCHYVMPWIMDFSVPEGGWRDLSKSKFRLNKGDKQLDLIYESSLEASSNITHNASNILQASAITVPHHTSEVLADITYYVYKARRMPKSFLCQYVRKKWVPAEYPSTIERLQEWTPDECIPEFFSDPQIFYSIHPDLCDLGVPWWSDSPEDFIKKHREALEGYHVSERLHQWIDLIFGYKLTGTAALKCKNLCLPLVDHHTSVHNYGMVQLFSHPHPHRLSRSIFSRCIAPKTFRSVTVKIPDAKDSGDDDTSSESLGKPSFLKGLRSKSSASNLDSYRQESRPENQTIVLPKDFNPLASLSNFESSFSFLAWAGEEKNEKSELQTCWDISDIAVYQFQLQDLFALGCVISEIALTNHCKTILQNSTFNERFHNILKLLQIYKQDIPRSLRNVIQLLLQLNPSYTQLEADSDFPISYPSVSQWGLPLPSPHQLLLPSIHTIPFPSFFPELYSFLSKLNSFSKEMSFLKEDLDEDISVSQKLENIAEKKVSFAAEHLEKLLLKLNSEAIEMLVPYIQEMFQDQNTALLATWHLFGIVAQALGPQQTCQHLLKNLTKVFDSDKPSPKHLKLYHRTFLLQLIVGLGLQNFLTHFTTILIEAIGGCKDYSPNSSFNEDMHLQKSYEHDMQKLAEVSEDMDECLTDDGGLEDPVLNKMRYVDQDYLNLQSDINNEEDNEIFDLDVNEEVLNDKDMAMSSANSMQKENIKENLDNPLIYATIEESTELDDNLDSCESCNLHDSHYSQSAPPLSYINEWRTYTDDSNKNTNSKKYIKSKSEIHADDCIVSPSRSCLSQEYNVSDVSAESMLWLAHRLGPVLTARYLTRNLLRMLTLCYDSSEKREIIHLPPESTENMLSISCKWLKGDLNAFKVLDCLSRIASLYGEQFIMLQYMKHIADLLNLCRKRVPASLESGLHGAMALLQSIIPYVSDLTLMDHLQDIIIKDIVLLVLRLISSMRIVYPGGGKSRLMISLRLLDVIYTISLRIGFEMTRKHMSNVLQKFFSCFDKVYHESCEYKELQDILRTTNTSSNTPMKEQALEEMRQTFTPELAFLTYIPFCKLAGGIHMEKMLNNDELIRNLCLIHDQNTELSSVNEPISNEIKISFHMTHRRDHSIGQEDSFVSGIFGKNVNVVGNRLDVHLGDESHLVMGAGEPVPSTSSNNSSNLQNIPKFDITLIKRKMDNCHRHLKGNWLAYWEHETGRSEKDYHFDFKQIKLQTFIGHTGTVRTVHVLDNENSFLTSSKDKTVKLWSLRSCGDGSAQIPSQWTYTQHRKSVFAVSFLDSLRLVGSCDSTVHIWDPFMGSCIKQLEPTKGSPITVLTAMPAPSTTFLAATTNSTIKFLDARTCQYMHEFKVSQGNALGLIRCLAVSPNGNWLAVGHSTGMLSVLDVRTGLLFGTWVGHEGEVLQLKAFNNTYFVTSSLQDHSLTAWKFEDNQAKCNLKGPMEPVTSICFYGNEVISGTTGNRIGLHSAIDKKANYSSTRLRSDTFKGVLTSMALLPLNRLLLLGTDNGNVALLS